MARKIVIRYDEVSLDRLVGFFVDAYTPETGAVASHEYFIDPAKGKAIIKLYIDEVERGAAGSPESTR